MAHASDLVGGQIVHDDDVARVQLGRAGRKQAAEAAAPSHPSGSASNGWLIWEMRVQAHRPPILPSGADLDRVAAKGNAAMSISEDQIQEALDAAADFGAIIERLKPLTFYDASLLPHSKSKMEEHLSLAMLATADEKMVGHLSNALYFLSWFQEGVGPEPLATKGRKLQDFNKENPVSIENIEAHSEKLLETIDENSDLLVELTEKQKKEQKKYEDLSKSILQKREKTSEGIGRQSSDLDKSGFENNISRNSLCPCGSGTKYKYCHGKLNRKALAPVSYKAKKAPAPVSYKANKAPAPDVYKAPPHDIGPAPKWQYFVAFFAAAFATAALRIILSSYFQDQITIENYESIGAVNLAINSIASLIIWISIYSLFKNLNIRKAFIYIFIIGAFSIMATIGRTMKIFREGGIEPPYILISCIIVSSVAWLSIFWYWFEINGRIRGKIDDVNDDIDDEYFRIKIKLQRIYFLIFLALILIMPFLMMYLQSSP